MKAKIRKFLRPRCFFCWSGRLKKEFEMRDRMI